MATQFPVGPPLDYHHLRLMAEFASGLTGQPVTFEYRLGADGKGSLLLVEPGTPTTNTPTSSFITATTPGRRTEAQVLVTSVEVSLVAGETLTLVNTPGLDGISFGTANPDALFWSDGAVLKFLVPYYASAAAMKAGSFLTDLLGAWYGFPATMPVVALAHLRTQPYSTASSLNPLTLHDTVGVVYVSSLQTGALALATLSEFKEMAGTWRTIPDLSQLQQIPSSVLQTDPGTPPNVGAVLLRRMAEFAAGYENEGLWFGLGDDEITPYFPGEVGTANVAQMVPAYTPSAVPAVEGSTGRVASVVIQAGGPGGALSGNLATQTDAVFWSGAVLQFMLPYYASVYGQYSAAVLTALLEQWGLIPPQAANTAIRDALLSVSVAGAEAAAAGVLAGNSASAALDEAAVGADATAEGGLVQLADETDGSGDSTVVALVHLPRSDWVDVNETGDTGGTGNIGGTGGRTGEFNVLVLSPNPAALTFQEITVPQ